MKIYLKLLYAIIFSFLLISCDDVVNTNAEFRERFVLTSIIDCESDKQIAYLTRTYDNTIVGRDPEIESVFVHGADIKMWYNYDVYDLIDTIIVDGNGNSNSCYVVNGLNPVGDKFIEIEALLPNNFLLSSITKIPSVSKLRVETSNVGEISKRSFNELNINWTNIGSYVYDPKLVINYYFHGDTNFNVIEHVVPLDIIDDKFETIYVYPKPSNQSSLSVDKNVLNSTMAEISKDDSIKSNYVILNMELQLKVYDENLSAYYSSSHQFLDQFSISLDPQLYSNIDSGLGIFASVISKKLAIGFDREYISSFGYRYAK
jgi:Domain of unknown function (DUF4249)